MSENPMEGLSNLSLRAMLLERARQLGITWPVEVVHLCELPAPVYHASARKHRLFFPCESRCYDMTTLHTVSALLMKLTELLWKHLPRNELARNTMVFVLIYHRARQRQKANRTTPEDSIILQRWYWLERCVRLQQSPQEEAGHLFFSEELDAALSILHQDSYYQRALRLNPLLESP